ncbi:kinesin-like protein Kip2p [Diutina catenulata]
MSSRTTPQRSRSMLGRSYGDMRPPSFSSPGGPGHFNVGPPPAPNFARPPSVSSPGRPSSRSSSAAGYRSSSRCSTPSFVPPYTGSISVSIRANPNLHGPSPWVLGPNQISHAEDGADYAFDHVFGESTNRHVYLRSCQDIVNKFVEGYNGTIFAYGMTGSGKTYTMKGEHARDPGVVRLAIDEVFQLLARRQPGTQYTLCAAYFEIYNEKVIDLLNPSSAGDLTIRSDAEFGTKVVGVCEPEITSPDQLVRLINSGDNHRKTGATDFNTRSSRSHSILQLKLRVQNVDGSFRYTTLSMCDLAGSERAVSQAERRKEGSFINKSLLALSTVIYKLSSGATDHIPYRDSKLTRLLQPALSGSSLVSILCTIHLGASTQSIVSETYNTLRFAARAKDIEMSVQQTKVSAADASVQLEQLRATIQKQQAEIASQQTEIMMLREMGQPVNGPAHSPTQSNHQLQNQYNQLEAENRILTEKIEHFTRLNDLRQTEMVILKNDAVNEILNLDYMPQEMMASFEEYHKRMQYEMAEYKSYISHLENELRQAHHPKPSNLEAQVRDQQEEIALLKEMINDKNHVIKNMSRTASLRRMVESRTNGKENEDPIKKRVPLTSAI